MSVLAYIRTVLHSGNHVAMETKHFVILTHYLLFHQKVRLKIHKPSSITHGRDIIFSESESLHEFLKVSKVIRRYTYSF